MNGQGQGEDGGGRGVGEGEEKDTPLQLCLNSDYERDQTERGDEEVKI